MKRVYFSIFFVSLLMISGCKFKKFKKKPQSTASTTLGDKNSEYELLQGSVKATPGAVLTIMCPTAPGETTLSRRIKFLGLGTFTEQDEMDKLDALDPCGDGSRFWTGRRDEDNKKIELGFYDCDWKVNVEYHDAPLGADSEHVTLNGTTEIDDAPHETDASKFKINEKSLMLLRRDNIIVDQPLVSLKLEATARR